MRSTHSISKRLLTLTSAVVLASWIAGCGGGEPSSSGGTSDAEADAPARAELCSLLTAEDIEQALGRAPGASSEGDEALGQCSWAAEGGDGSAVVLTLERAALSSFDDFVAAFGEEFGGEDPPRERFHPVEELGEWAMYLADDDMVRVFRGDNVLEVSSSGADEEQVVDLARRAVARWN